MPRCWWRRPGFACSRALDVLATALAFAWAWDALFGEPGNRWHPVAWLGAVLGPVGAWLTQQRPRVAFSGGAVAWCAGAALLGGAAAWLQAQASRWPWWLVLPLLVVALKPCFAWRMLRDEVAAVEATLATSGLDAARARLARLVSRDVSTMDADALRETAIETLAENLNDSVVAPLFWCAVAGLPGAVVYRFANTADAMWGYRGRWEWAGKWAARADDVLSWLPARITAACLLPPWRWAGLAAEAPRTPSPNGGWPMAAMALRLGVRLRKPGVYALNAGAPPPGASALPQALAAARDAAWGCVLLAVLACARLAWSH